MNGHSTLKDIIKEAHETAKSKGWHDKDVPISETILNFHAEASEAWESYRNKEPLLWYGPDGKPEGQFPEFADLIFRILDHIGETGETDLFVEATQKKMEYNKGRSYRHGGKQA